MRSWSSFARTALKQRLSSYSEKGFPEAFTRSQPLPRQLLLSILMKKSCVGVVRARQEIRCAFWRELRAGRCKAPRRRRCGDIVEERQRRRCPPAAAPLRAAARRPAGCVARSLHTAAGMLVARALPAGLGASSKMYTLFPDGPLAVNKALFSPQRREG